MQLLITTSLGETSGIVLPGTGVAMNNFLGETDVTHPLLLKCPGQRLLTMCAPLIFYSLQIRMHWVLVAQVGYLALSFK